MSNILPAQSLLAVLPASGWEALVEKLATGIHKADFWRPEDLSKPLLIKEIRELISFASRTSVQEKRLAIVPAADQMGAPAANALLKLLEEPSADLHVLLLVESDQLLPTVRSRLSLLPALPASATMEESGIIRQSLAKLDPQDPSDRKEAQRLLYLSPLIHQGIRPEVIIPS